MTSGTRLRRLLAILRRRLHALVWHAREEDVGCGEVVVDGCDLGEVDLL
jgi:hypothetical protein